MSELIRLSISLEKTLLDRLESMIGQSHYTNRSEFIRDMIRERLVEEQWADEGAEVVGTITLIYDHHSRQLSDKLTSIQHGFHHNIMATTHVHLTHDLCAEMIMVRGGARDIQALSGELRKQRGVLHGALSMSSTGEKLK